MGMTTDQLKQMVEDARRATAGMWDSIDGRTLFHVETRIDNPHGAGKPICSIPKKRSDDANHIANCSPETIIAMAEELIRAREALTLAALALKGIAQCIPPDCPAEHTEKLIVVCDALIAIENIRKGT